MLMTLPSYFQNIQTIEDVLNEDMENFGRYFEQNELLLNLKKGEDGSNALWNLSEN